VLIDGADHYWWQDRIAELAQLRPDWDSYDALAPSGVAVRSAYEVLMWLFELEFAIQKGGMMPGDIYPLPNGSIEAEWIKGDQVLAIQARTDGTFHLMTKKGHGRAAQYTEVDGQSNFQAFSRVWDFLQRG